jgi:polysaccharide biosynthesis/export protein
MSLPIIPKMPIRKNMHETQQTTQAAHCFVCRRRCRHDSSAARFWRYRLTMTRNVLTLLATCVLATATGCHAIDFYTPSLQEPVPPELEIPRELSMVSLPPYRIEPPDELFVGVQALVPRPSYQIGQFDILQINALGVITERPIHSFYRVESDGMIYLGPPYGAVRLSGLTIDEAQAEIVRSLQFLLKSPEVSIQVARSATSEQISRRYRVGPDGMLNLGRCGMVYVTDKTVTEARQAVETQLAQYFDAPKASVEVVRYNSRSYYVVTDSLIAQKTMAQFPITGNETVLDAIGQVQTISNVAGKTMWVARPAPGDAGQEQILPVDWDAIAHRGITDTNYQILPGDRVFIVDDSLVAANAIVGRILSPLERTMAMINLGVRASYGSEVLGREYNRIRRH